MLTKLEAVRKIMGISQTELAKMARVPRTNLAKAESGEKAYPKLMDQVSRALGIPREEIFDDEGRAKQVRVVL